jgi:enoyl-CoA hydratase/carnithine racemase
VIDLARESKRMHRNDASPVLYEKQPPLGLIWLNRPQVHNAYNTAMRDALFEVLGAVRDDPEVRVGVLLGKGPSFCSGGDLSEFGTAPSPVWGRAARWKRDVAGLLASLPKPTIAGVHGYAVGGGLEFALLCDLCVLSDDAKLAYPETGLGTIPGVGGTQTTPRLAGPTRALEVLWTGRWLHAEEALAWGLAVRVVPRVRLVPAVVALARRIARIPGALLSSSKRAVWEGLDCEFSRGLALERRLALRSSRGHGRQNTS